MNDEGKILNEYKKIINENLGFAKMVADQDLQNKSNKYKADSDNIKADKKRKQKEFNQKYFPTLSKAPGKFKKAFSKAMSSKVEMNNHKKTSDSEK